MWVETGNLAGMGFHSNEVVQLRLDCQSQPCNWSTFTPVDTKSCSSSKNSLFRMNLYPSFMMAAAHRALGDDCNDRECKRIMGLYGKDFHFGLSGLKKVWRANYVLNIINKTFFQSLFSLSGLFFPLLSFPEVNTIMGQIHNSQGNWEIRAYNTVKCSVIMEDWG